MPTISEAVAANEKRIAAQGENTTPSTIKPSPAAAPPFPDGPVDRPRRGSFPRSLIAADTFEKVTGQFYGRMRARTLTNPAGSDLPANASHIGISKTTVVTQAPAPDIDPFLHFRGVWNASTVYLINDVVIDNLSAYVAIAGNTNVEPDGGLPATVRQNAHQGFQPGNSGANTIFANNLLAGSTILFSILVGNLASGATAQITDTQGNVYTLLASASTPNSTTDNAFTYTATAKAGPCTIHVAWVGGSGFFGGYDCFATEVTGLTSLDNATSVGVSFGSGSFPAMSLACSSTSDLMYSAAQANNVAMPPGALVAPPGLSSSINQQVNSAQGIAWTLNPSAGTNTLQWGQGFVGAGGGQFVGTAVSFKTVPPPPPNTWVLLSKNLNFRGVWQGNASPYNPFDYVEYQGSMWVCVHATSTSPSLTNTAWQLLAQGVGFVNTQTSSYAPTATQAAADQGRLVSFNISSPATYTLASPPPNSGWVGLVENIGTATLTISPNGLNLDGTGTSVTLGQNQMFGIFTDGTNYFSFHGVNRITVPGFLTITGPDKSGSVSIGSATVPPSFALIGPTICAGSGPLAARQIQGSDLLNLNISSASFIGSTTSQSGNLTLCGAVLPAGLYRISVYMVVNDPGAGNLGATITWNDGTQSQTVTPASISTTALGTVAQFEVIVESDGVHDISYNFTLS